LAINNHLEMWFGILLHFISRRRSQSFSSPPGIFHNFNEQKNKRCRRCSGNEPNDTPRRNTNYFRRRHRAKTNINKHCRSSRVWPGIVNLNNEIPSPRATDSSYDNKNNLKKLYHCNDKAPEKTHNRHPHVGK